MMFLVVSGYVAMVHESKDKMHWEVGVPDLSGCHGLVSMDTAHLESDVKDMIDAWYVEATNTGLVPPAIKPFPLSEQKQDFAQLFREGGDE